jgi:O-antigen/teichoic acid export membrane protein
VTSLARINYFFIVGFDAVFLLKSGYMTVINRLLQKLVALKYNLLALGYVTLHFIFIALLGRLFGASSETDVYFLAITVITYLGHIVQAVWEAWTPWYVERLKQNRREADKLYSVFIFWITLCSLLLIGLYFLLRLFWTVEAQAGLFNFLDVFIVFLLIQNLIFINREYLTLHGYYGMYYAVDILASVLKIIGVWWMWDAPNVHDLAWIMLAAYSVGLLWQWGLIFGKLKAKLSWTLRAPDDRVILWNSSKMKLGSLAYDGKEILLAMVLTAAGPGIYSLFSYASKFAAVILEVVNAPIMSMFSAKLTHAHEEKRYCDIPPLVKGALSQTVALYLVATVIMYVVMPQIMLVFFGDKFTTAQVDEMRWIFLLLSGYTVTIVLESPFARAVSLFRYYTYGMTLNFIFGAIMLSGYGLLWWLGRTDDYLLFLGVLVVAQTSNYLLYWRKYHAHLQPRLALSRCKDHL